MNNRERINQYLTPKNTYQMPAGTPSNLSRIPLALIYAIYGLWIFFTFSDISVISRSIVLGILALLTIMVLFARTTETIQGAGMLAMFAIILAFFPTQYENLVLIFLLMPLGICSLSFSNQVSKSRRIIASAVLIASQFLLWGCGILLCKQLDVFPEDLFEIFTWTLYFGILVTGIFLLLVLPKAVFIPKELLPPAKSLSAGCAALLSFLCFLTPAFHVCGFKIASAEEPPQGITGIKLVQYAVSELFDTDSDVPSFLEELFGGMVEEFKPLLIAIAIFVPLMVFAGIVLSNRVEKEANNKASGYASIVFSSIILLTYWILTLVLVFKIKDFGGQLFELFEIKIFTYSTIPAVIGLLAAVGYIIISQPQIQNAINCRAEKPRETSQTYSPQPAEPQQKPNTIALLIQYKELLDKGIITEEEFQQKKTELLNKNKTAE